MPSRKPIRDLDSYHALTGISSADSTIAETVGLKNLERALAAELKKKDSGFGRALNQLSEENKARAIAALIANNSAIIVEILSPLLSVIGLGTSLPYLSQITEHPPGSENWLSPTVGLLIEQMLRAEVNDPQALTRFTRILTNAMQQIPETLIHTRGKVLISTEIDYFAAQGISDYAYSEALEPLKENRFSGKITLNEFKAALKAPSLDFSQFTLLSMGALQNLLGDRSELQQDFNQIRQLYLGTEYEKSIAKMQELVSKQQSLVGKELLALMTNRSSQLSEVKIYKNYSRRLFENRLSQLHSGQTQSLESIDRIARALIGKAVNTAEEAENAILSITNLVMGNPNSLQLEQRAQALKKNSNNYKLKDRVPRPVFQDKEDDRYQSPMDEKEAFSRNKGLLPANAANFYDELSKKVMRNRIVDISETDDTEGGYSYSRPRSAFAGSFSGHCFLMVAILEEYMNQHTGDPKLQADINNFIKTAVSAYISRGYHSYFEMIDVFNEPEVKDIFSNKKINLDFSWVDKILENACKDAQEYTIRFCLKSAINLESRIKVASHQKPSNDVTLKEDRDKTTSSSKEEATKAVLDSPKVPHK